MSNYLTPAFALDAGLLILLIIVAFAIVKMRSLFAIVMLQGVYSLLSAAWFVSLDAVDVAFTEAAVGAGITTVLMLGAMLLTKREANPMSKAAVVFPFIIVAIAAISMFYAVPDMPAFGDANAPANAYIGQYYIEASKTDIKIPNVVTAVLASYRSFDTFGETVVIFMAGLGVLLLLGLNGHAGRWKARPNGVDVNKLEEKQ